MSNKPHIVVFKLKELIYTGIFIILGILLIVLFITMFKSDKKKPSASSGEVNAVNNDVSKKDNSASESTDSANSDKDSSKITASDSTASDEVASKNAVSDNNDSDKAGSGSSDSNSFGSENASDNTETTYNPGVYTSSLMLNNSSLELEVCVDSHRINSISVKNIDEAVTTMYPLIKNSINDLSNQIINSQSLENITYTDDCKYTYMILLDAISTTLDKARK